MSVFDLRLGNMLVLMIVLGGVIAEESVVRQGVDTFTTKLIMQDLSQVEECEISYY